MPNPDIPAPLLAAHRAAQVAVTRTLHEHGFGSGAHRVATARLRESRELLDETRRRVT